MAVERLAQGVPAALQFPWQLLPGDPSLRLAAQLVIGPALENRQIIRANGREPQVEAGGQGGPLHQEDHQPIGVRHQTDLQQGGRRALGPTDQTQQASEVGQTPGQMQHQVVEGGPLQTHPQ